MNWLLWREFRLNRWILVTGVSLILLSRVIGFLLAWFAVDEELDNGAGIVLSLFCSALTLAMLGGNAFAGERADRSAEFIAYLPLERRQMLAGKLILSLIAVVVIYVINLAALLHEDVRREGILALVAIGSAGLVVFSVSWLVSSIQSSPALATVSGIMTPIVVVVSAMNMPDEPLRRLFGTVSLAVAMTVAIGCLCIGSWHFFRGSSS